MDEMFVPEPLQDMLEKMQKVQDHLLTLDKLLAEARQAEREGAPDREEKRKVAEHKKKVLEEELVPTFDDMVDLDGFLSQYMKEHPRYFEAVQKIGFKKRELVRHFNRLFRPPRLGEATSPLAAGGSPSERSPSERSPPSKSPSKRSPSKWSPKFRRL